MYKYQEIIITDNFTKKISFKTYNAAIHDINFWVNRCKENGYKYMQFKIIDKGTKKELFAGKFSW